MTTSRHGFTLIETLLSIALFGTMLATVLTTFTTGQSSFFTTEAFLQANQSARSALDTIAQDLSGSLIRSYANIGVANGNGKVYVKFRRIRSEILEPAGSDPDVDGRLNEPYWDVTYWMYIWCRGDRMAAAPCSSIIAKPEWGAPASGQLLLVVTNAFVGNPDGENKLPWAIFRIIAQDVTLFQVGLKYDNGDVVPAMDVQCGALSPGAILTAGEGCVNLPGAIGAIGNPFGNATRTPQTVELLLQVSPRTPSQRVVPSTAARERVKLRNPQRVDN